MASVCSDLYLIRKLKQRKNTQNQPKYQCYVVFDVNYRQIKERPFFERAVDRF